MTDHGRFGGYDGPALDTLIGFHTDPDTLYAALREQLLRDDESKTMNMPAGYMFHDVPELHGDDTNGSNPSVGGESPDPVAITLAEMDRFGIEVGLISLGANPEAAERALRDHPDRFVASITLDPNAGTKDILRLRDAVERFDVRAVSIFPHGNVPAVAIDEPRMYPIYSVCEELGLPVFITVGIAGPRVPSAPQRVELLDRVMYDFPKLTVVMRHGAEPWVDLAVKLMLKWPNLYYSTSAFSPKYYPDEIVRYANTRGADKIIYAGYYPMGLTLERIFTELPDVGFRDEVWPKFLYDNAARVLGLQERS